MSIVDFKKLFISTLVLLSVPALGLAQDSDSDTVSIDAEALDEEARTIDEVVVTGSRLKRSTYTSISPLQVITAQVSREVGLIDAADILQQSTSAGGQQVDLTFGGFVLDNGPGSSEISLRGLGPARTLILLNGRRLSPAGVEGAPFSPDVNLIPASLVQQYDILLDGASSVYGSDAVAGVVNVIMRKDFDGFELEAYSHLPDHGAGVNNIVSAVYGKNFDRGFFGIGVEYDDRESIPLSDRDWTAGCAQEVEVDENGQIRTRDIWYETFLGMEWDDCSVGPLARRTFLFDGGFGSVYYTPGSSNTGIPNFTESSLFGFGVDANGDGQTDMTFRDYSLNGRDQQADLFPDISLLSVMSYGEYTMEGEMNLTPFFEASFNKRKFETDSGQPQLFPDVPGSNPYNICNPNGLRGVDCGLAFDSLMTNPNFVADFGLNFESLCADFGFSLAQCTPSLFGLVGGPIGPILVEPIVAVDGDRDNAVADVEMRRIVVGLRGDLPNVDWGQMNDWTFELSLIASKSKGTSSRVGVRGDLMNESLFTSMVDPANGDVVCGLDTTGDGIPDGFNADGRACVPIDMFAPSLYPEGVVGDFATQAERDYLFDSRDFFTEYEQTVVTAFMTGDLFNMPAGPVAAGIGFEYREDIINSVPDDVAAGGLLFGFFLDEGATGEKFTREYFAEIEFPLLANMPAAEELTLNLSGRHTKDEFYGSQVTGSIKLGYRPINSLLLRGTYGSSYRAPNLRENFLANLTGFTPVFDPCFIPESAINPITGGYDPALETRDPVILANCAANGADPTMLNNNGFNTYFVEVSRNGATDLLEENSDSLSLGFAFEQPWFEAFDLTIGATYYEIEIEDALLEPNASFIVNDCYLRPSLDSTFCNRIQRDSAGFISLVDVEFINRDNTTIRGLDINVAFDMNVTMFSRPVDIGLDLALSRSYEASDTFIDQDGTPVFDDDSEEFGFPKLKGQLGLRFDVGDFRLTWASTYIHAVEQDVDGIDDFDNIFGFSDTCLGPPSDVNCRDVGFADSYDYHSMSLYYYGDVWTLGAGVRNVFDDEPPIVDATEVLSVNNTPIGYGYDLRGRTYFLNVHANFGGGL